MFTLAASQLHPLDVLEYDGGVELLVDLVASLSCVVLTGVTTPLPMGSGRVGMRWCWGDSQVAHVPQSQQRYRDSAVQDTAVNVQRARHVALRSLQPAAEALMRCAADVQIADALALLELLATTELHDGLAQRLVDTALKREPTTEEVEAAGGWAHVVSSLAFVANNNATFVPSWLASVSPSPTVPPCLPVTLTTAIHDVCQFVRRSSLMRNQIDPDSLAACMSAAGASTGDGLDVVCNRFASRLCPSLSSASNRAVEQSAWGAATVLRNRMPVHVRSLRFL